MKIILHSLCIGLLLYSCTSPINDSTTLNQEPTKYEPVLISRASLEESVKLEDARSIRNAGKIYRQGSLLFINEKYEGIHVYDNSDPRDPLALAFIKIPGNLDIAIKDDIIYADNSVDLIAIEYTNSDIEVVSRNTNVFPEILPPDLGIIPSDYLPENRPENTVIIKWIEK